jgi:hypothetical protein
MASTGRDIQRRHRHKRGHTKHGPGLPGLIRGARRRSSEPTPAANGWDRSLGPLPSPSQAPATIPRSTSLRSGTSSNANFEWEQWTGAQLAGTRPRRMPANYSGVRLGRPRVARSPARSLRVQSSSWMDNGLRRDRAGNPRPSPDGFRHCHSAKQSKTNRVLGQYVSAITRGRPPHRRAHRHMVYSAPTGRVVAASSPSRSRPSSGGGASPNGGPRAARRRHGSGSSSTVSSGSPTLPWPSRRHRTSCPRR